MFLLVFRSVWKIKNMLSVYGNPDQAERLGSLEVGIDPAAVTESYSVGPNSARFII